MSQVVVKDMRTEPWPECLADLEYGALFALDGDVCRKLCAAQQFEILRAGQEPLESSGAPGRWVKRLTDIKLTLLLENA